MPQDKEYIMEQDCTIEFQGKQFTSGGAYLLPCTDGKYRGGVYIKDENRTAITWHGELIAKLDSFTTYRGNFCKMRRISFTWQNMKFVGDYCPDWSELCHVRTTKKYHV